MRFSILTLLGTASLLISAGAQAQSYQNQVQYSPAPAVQQPAQPVIKSWGGNGQPSNVVVQQGAPIDSIGGGAIPSLPVTLQNANGINFMTGGIGDEELDALRSHQHDFALQLLMTAAGGEYISDAAVTLTDSNGKATSFPNAGPYLYVALPPGKYQLQITTPQQSVIKSMSITVPQNGAVKQQVRLTD